MHLIKDENGNLCAHAHEHEHPHAHNYEHTHVHSHEHGMEEEHKHCHEETCDCNGSSCKDGVCGAKDPVKENVALLTYMLQHNEHHAAELDQMAAKLRETGMEQASEQIRKAVDEFQKGNMYLGVALAFVKEQA